MFVVALFHENPASDEMTTRVDGIIDRLARDAAVLKMSVPLSRYRDDMRPGVYITHGGDQGMGMFVGLQLRMRGHGSTVPQLLDLAREWDELVTAFAIEVELDTLKSILRTLGGGPMGTPRPREYTRSLCHAPGNQAIGPFGRAQTNIQQWLDDVSAQRQALETTAAVPAVPRPRVQGTAMPQGTAVPQVATIAAITIVPGAADLLTVDEASLLREIVRGLGMTGGTIKCVYRDRQPEHVVVGWQETPLSDMYCFTVNLTVGAARMQPATAAVLQRAARWGNPDACAYGPAWHEYMRAAAVFADDEVVFIPAIREDLDFSTLTRIARELRAGHLTPCRVTGIHITGGPDNNDRNTELEVAVSPLLQRDISLIHMSIPYRRRRTPSIGYTARMSSAIPESLRTALRRALLHQLGPALWQISNVVEIGSNQFDVTCRRVLTFHTHVVLVSLPTEPEPTGITLTAPGAAVRYPREVLTEISRVFTEVILVDPPCFITDIQGPTTGGQYIVSYRDARFSDDEDDMEIRLTIPADGSPAVIDIGAGGGEEETISVTSLTAARPLPTTEQPQLTVTWARPARESVTPRVLGAIETAFQTCTAREARRVNIVRVDAERRVGDFRVSFQIGENVQTGLVRIPSNTSLPPQLFRYADDAASDRLMAGGVWMSQCFGDGTTNRPRTNSPGTQQRHNAITGYGRPDTNIGRGQREGATRRQAQAEAALAEERANAFPINWQSTSTWRAPNSNAPGETIDFPLTTMTDEHTYQTILWLIRGRNDHARLYGEPPPEISLSLYASRWLVQQPIFRSLMEQALLRELTFPSDVVNYLRGYVLERTTQADTLRAPPWQDPGATYQRHDLQRAVEKLREDAAGRPLRHIELE